MLAALPVSPVDLSELLGRRVRALRASSSLTVRELSKRSGLSQRLLALIEAGQANPTLSSMAELASALSVPVSALLVEEALRARPIALLGLRGAGKSTIGVVVARALGWAFVELDRTIEQEAGLNMTTLFELHGDAHVRHVEARALAAVLGDDVPAVIACGGGLVTEHNTYATLRARALTVWLKATPQEHWDRVRAQGDERPMAQRDTARAELDALWHARAPLYAQAALHIDTTTMNASDAADVIVAAARA